MDYKLAENLFNYCTSCNDKLKLIIINNIDSYIFDYIDNKYKEMKNYKKNQMVFDYIDIINIIKRFINENKHMFYDNYTKDIIVDGAYIRLLIDTKSINLNELFENLASQLGNKISLINNNISFNYLLEELGDLVNEKSSYIIKEYFITKKTDINITKSQNRIIIDVI